MIDTQIERDVGLPRTDEFIPVHDYSDHIFLQNSGYTLARKVHEKDFGHRLTTRVGCENDMMIVSS